MDSNWSLSLGLFSHHEYPSYFNAPGLLIRWEIAVLVVAAICALPLCLPLRSVHRPFFAASVILTPFVFGLIFSIFQIQMIFHELAVAGWTSPCTPAQVVFCDLFYSHIGLYCSILLLLLWLASRVFRSNSSRIHSHL